MKTDRICFPLVSLAILAALIIALVYPSFPSRVGETAAVTTTVSNN